MDHTELFNARLRLVLDKKELQKARLGYNYKYENTFLPSPEEIRRLETEIKLGDQAKCTKEWLFVYKHRLPPETMSKEPLTIMERCRLLTRDVAEIIGAAQEA